MNIVKSDSVLFWKHQTFNKKFIRFYMWSANTKLKSALNVTGWKRWREKEVKVMSLSSVYTD